MGERRRYRGIVHDSARWDGFEFREGDIVISTPPKCGTTWMQMLCALLIFRTPDLPAPLATLSPWLDMQSRALDAVLRDLDGQQHRRFIKTHTPLDGVPFDPRATYLFVARDPRDVALSWADHMDNIDIMRFMAIRVEAVGVDDFEELGITEMPPQPPDDPVERFWQWMDAATVEPEVSSLGALVHHTATFWERRHEPNVHLFHYGDLRRDLAGEMGRLAEVLDVDPPSDDLVAAASFEAMKARADDLIPNSDTPFWNDNRQFFRQARSAGWRDLLDDAGQARYEQQVEGLAPADLVSWLHDGSVASDDERRPRVVR